MVQNPTPTSSAEFSVAYAVFWREDVKLLSWNFHSAFTLPKLGMIYAKNGLGGKSDGEEHRKPLKTLQKAKRVQPLQFLGGKPPILEPESSVFEIVLVKLGGGGA